MNLFRTRHNGRTAEELHRQHGDRRRAARSRQDLGLSDPMSTVALRAMR